MKNNIMESFVNIKHVTFQFMLVFLLFTLLLWISSFAYAVLYYLYIPAVAHILPVYLQYPSPCLRGSCAFPSANMTLTKPGQYALLAGSQSYAIEITLEMPESEINSKIGMFMVRLAMLGENGNVVKASSRPVVLHYRSRLFRIIYTLFFAPGLLTGTVEEKQVLVISLFEQYVEDSYNPAHFAYVEVQALGAEVYSSSLRIHAQFTGLRYFMYYWPLFSTFVGVGINFYFLSVLLVLISFLYKNKSRKGSSQEETDEDANEEEEEKDKKSEDKEDSKLIKMLKEEDEGESKMTEKGIFSPYKPEKGKLIRLLLERGKGRKADVKVEKADTLSPLKRFSKSFDEQEWFEACSVKQEDDDQEVGELTSSIRKKKL